MAYTEQYKDIEIIDQILEGKTAQYEILIRRYNPYLYKTGRSYNYSHEDTQDLMQETFIDAYKNLKNFEGLSSFKTWITRIMLNHCNRKSQKLSYKNEIVENLSESSRPVFTGSSDDAYKIVQNRELGHVIANALGTIPLDYRMVFSLREMNGFSVAETAKLLETSEGNVKTRLNRAKAMLRKEIERNYSTEEIFEFNLMYCDAIVKNVMNRINQLAPFSET